MLLLLAAAIAQPVAPGIALVPGQVTPDKGPDGNSVFIDAPDGLILVDTGRHPEHRDKLLAHAKSRPLFRARRSSRPMPSMARSPAS